MSIGFGDSHRLPTETAVLVPVVYPDPLGIAQQAAWHLIVAQTVMPANAPLPRLSLVGNDGSKKIVRCGTERQLWLGARYGTMIRYQQ